MRIFYIKNHAESIVKELGKQVLYDYKSRKINQEEILERRKEMVLRLPLNRMNKMAEVMEKEKSLNEANFIYSMWSGYIANDPKFREFCKKHQILLKKIHTSGHAYFYDLKKLVEALTPKSIIPIHTLSGDNFKNYFPNVARIKDGELFTIP